eukprot:scaffold167025_cov19-Tisochrysis_lutea.AAC.1
MTHAKSAPVLVPGPSTVPSTDGYSSSRSSELEAQRQSLAAALEQKRAELAAEQKRHQSAQKRQVGGKVM